MVQPCGGGRGKGLLVAAVGTARLTGTLRSGGVFSHGNFSHRRCVRRLLGFRHFTDRLVLNSRATELSRIVTTMSTTTEGGNTAKGPSFITNIHKLGSVRGRVTVRVSNGHTRSSITRSLAFISHPFFQSFQGICITSRRARARVSGIVLAGGNVVIIRIGSTGRGVAVNRSNELLCSGDRSCRGRSVNSGVSTGHELLGTHVRDGLERHNLSVPMRVSDCLIFIAPGHLRIAVASGFHRRR